MNLFIQKNENYSFKENIHSSEKWIIAQGYLLLRRLQSRLNHKNRSQYISAQDMLQHILLRSDISFFESIVILCSLPSQNFHSREFEIEYVWTKLDTFDTEIVLIILSKIQQRII